MARTVIAFDLDKLHDKLRDAARLERNAMRRLRLAQTIFDKRYNTRLRLQSQIVDALTESKSVAARLTGKKEK